MQIAKDVVVGFHYKLKEEGGDFFESSTGEVEAELGKAQGEGKPVLYLHGHNGMLKGLEDALAGKSAGDQCEVTLPPEKAYGKRREGDIQRIAKKHLLTKGKLQPGQMVQVKTKNGPEDAIVVKVGLKNVDIDANHPLAGKTLVFAVSIEEVREATADELSKGVPQVNTCDASPMDSAPQCGCC